MADVNELPPREQMPLEALVANDLRAIFDHLDQLHWGQRSLQETFDAFAEEQHSMVQALSELKQKPGGTNRRSSISASKRRVDLNTEPRKPAEIELEDQSATADDKETEPAGPAFTNNSQKDLSSLKAMTSALGGEQTKYFNNEEEDPAKALPSSGLGKFVLSDTFDRATAAVLCLNMVFIGFQVEYSFYEKMPLPVLIGDYIFCAAFLIELLLRMVGLGCRRFWCHPQVRAWNIFDLIIVSLSTMDTAISATLSEDEESVLGNISVLRVIRVVRIVRVLRVIRVAKFFTDLRILLAAIVSTMKTASFAFFLIIMIIYMFAIALAQLAAEHLRDMRSLGQSFESTESQQDFEFFFGGLANSVFSLYMSITGGVDWKDMAVPLFDVGPFAVFLFLMYSSLMILCVLNVLLGIFCQNALDTAATDKENIIQHQLKEKHLFVERLKELFSSWDDSGDGKCTAEEFMKHLSDQKTQALLRSMEIEGRDAVTLFQLLDDDSSGEVDLNEFVTGCITLRGPAKAVHVEQVNVNNRILLDRVDDLEVKLEDLSKGLNGINEGRLETPQREDSSIKV